MKSNDPCRWRVLKTALLSVAVTFCIGLFYAGCIRDYFPRRAGPDTLSPDQRFAIEAYTWIRFPRSEILDPAGVVRFRVRDWRRGGSVVASAESDLHEWDEFVQPVVVWGEDWVELTKYERWNTPRPIRLQWNSNLR